MRYLKSLFFVLILVLNSCSQNKGVKVDKAKAEPKENTKIFEVSNIKGQQTEDKAEIQNLINEVVKWSESDNRINVLPVLMDEKERICIGFDHRLLKENLKKLKATNFFSAEFIENYNKIIVTLDKKMKDGEISKWPTGELPPLSFANDVNPWCLCQDEPGPAATVAVYAVDLSAEQGALYWKWAGLSADASADWKDFSYMFNVIKENHKWKISYLQGFDFKESIKTRG